MKDSIKHIGEVVSISDQIIAVSIIQNSACADCHAKTACSISDSKEKIIEIPNRYPSVEKGQKVVIEGKTTMGMKAVLYAFVLPLILLFLVLILTLYIKGDEGLAALLAITSLGIYCFVLFLLRDTFKKKFIFEIVRF